MRSAPTLKYLNDALGVGGDTREIRAVEYRALQRWSDVKPVVRRRARDGRGAANFVLHYARVFQPVQLVSGLSILVCRALAAHRPAGIPAIYALRLVRA